MRSNPTETKRSIRIGISSISQKGALGTTKGGGGGITNGGGGGIICGGGGGGIINGGGGGIICGIRGDVGTSTKISWPNSGLLFAGIAFGGESGGVGKSTPF